MKFSACVAAGLALAAGSGAAVPPAAAPLSGFPFSEEALNYTVNWPSGLSLGEGHLRARHSGNGWAFELTLDASVPGFDVKDSYTSRAGAELCSMEFTKSSAHGTRKVNERESVEGTKVTRTTDKGGKSEFSAPACVKDALTLLFYARRELGQGRVPPAQQLLFGGMYRASLQYAGAQTIEVAGKAAVSDKVVCSLTGPNSNPQFEIYFARDAARTPLSIRVPLSMGRFSMELVR